MNRALLLGLVLSLIASASSAEVLRDSIGPDSSMTNEEFGVESFWQIGSSQDTTLLTYELSPAAAVELTLIDVVAGSLATCNVPGARPCYENMSFYVMAWADHSDIEGPLTSPATPGKLFHVDVTNRTTVTNGFGIFYDTFTSGNYETALVSIDLTGIALQCPAAGCVVGLLGAGDIFVDGGFVVRDSTQAGAFDTGYNDNNGSNPTAVARAGVRIEAIPVSSGTPVPALGGFGLAVLAGGLVAGGGFALNRRSGAGR